MVLDILIAASAKFIFVLLQMTVAGSVAAVNSRKPLHVPVLLLFVVVVVVHFYFYVFALNKNIPKAV